MTAREKPPPGTVVTSSKGNTYVIPNPPPPIRTKPTRTEFSIGKYDLIKPLGTGAFGKVYEVRENIESIVFHPKTPIFPSNDEMTYAMKLEERDSELSMLQHEASILLFLMKYSVSSVPKLYWYGTEDTWRYMTTTLYSGHSLQYLLTDGRIRWKDVLQWFKDACKILENIHCTGVIHRDIKPAHFVQNISTGRWNLIDFGLATYYVDDKQNILENESRQHVIGTPNYMSLYIHQGNTASRRDDMISLVYIFLNAYLHEFCNNTELPWITNVQREQYESSTLVYTDINHPYHQALSVQKDWKMLYKWLQTQKAESSVLEMIQRASLWSFSGEPTF